MNTIATTSTKLNPRMLLSTLWIVVLINMIKADVLSLYTPGIMDQLAETVASTGASIPQLMLFGAIMGNLSIAMIILSRVLVRGVNRPANVVMGVVTIVYIWGGAASFPHYTFIATVETICLLLIIWTAWRWRNTDV